MRRVVGDIVDGQQQQQQRWFSSVAAVQGIFAAHRHHHYAQAYGPPMVNCPGFALLRHDPRQTSL